MPASQSLPTWLPSCSQRLVRTRQQISAAMAALSRRQQKRRRPLETALPRHANSVVVSRSIFALVKAIYILNPSEHGREPMSRLPTRIYLHCHNGSHL